MAVGGALFSGGGRAAPASKALVEVIIRIIHCHICITYFQCKNRIK